MFLGANDQNRLAIPHSPKWEDLSSVGVPAGVTMKGLSRHGPCKSKEGTSQKVCSAREAFTSRAMTDGTTCNMKHGIRNSAIDWTRKTWHRPSWQTTWDHSAKRLHCWKAHHHTYALFQRHIILHTAYPNRADKPWHTFYFHLLWKWPIEISLESSPRLTLGSRSLGWQGDGGSWHYVSADSHMFIKDEEWKKSIIYIYIYYYCYYIYYYCYYYFYLLFFLYEKKMATVNVKHKYATTDCYP